ncbi:MAG: non-canonical purine NTP diphosphatase [Muribaculaceae bacterium]|nr:non-canonical purine NTP diphosphatase [Muribaculaceae bacterium]
MNKKKQLVFATNNPHKLLEARQIMGDTLEIVSLADIGCHDDIPETAETLEGNALIKARWVRDRYGFDCFADDTGLMVDALAGAPGVYSARYAGPECTPADNMKKLLAEMQGVTDRNARFSTVIALSLNGEEHTFEGNVEGEIATEQHGNGGFGYDPVFIANETGKSFAEMTPESKNNISHRGRALAKLREFLAAITTLLILAFAIPNVHADTWRAHPSFDGQTLRMIDTPNCLYLLGTTTEYVRASKYQNSIIGNLYRIDNNTKEIEWLSKQNNLSEDLINAIAYNFDKHYLCIAYTNGNIDLLYDDGKVANIPGLMLADASLTKQINDITFDSANDRIYLATAFGYISLNDRNPQVDTSRDYHTALQSAAFYDGKLWTANEHGIRYGDPKEFSFDNLTYLPDTKDVWRLIPVGKSLYFLTGNNTWQTLSIIQKDDAGNYTHRNLSRYKVMGLEPMSGNKLLEVSTNEARIIDEDARATVQVLPYDMQRVMAGTADGRDFWISDGRKGIIQMRATESGWQRLTEYMRPNASAAYYVTSMAYSPNYGLLVRNYGIDRNFNDITYFDTPDQISAYKGMEWTPKGIIYTKPDMKGLLYDNPNAIAIDPNNPDHLYCGSLHNGLLRLDLKDPAKSLHFSKPNDFLGGYGETGFIAAVPENTPGVGWDKTCAFAPPAFDAYGTLWTAYCAADKPSSDTSTELWYWTAENRGATTSASDFKPFGKLKISDSPSSTVLIVKPLTTSENKNIVMVKGGINTSPLVILDHNATLANKTDDKIARMKVIHDSDGNQLEFNHVYSWHEDSETGNVWVGYGGGIFEFNPRQALSDPGSVRRIKVARNDGTGLADYLLDGVQVNDIISDKSGRKWFATQGAGVVCTSADGRRILKEYTTENSDLRGDIVYSICPNPDNNSMMISTDQGLCELFVAGVNSADSYGARAYPNPVRPHYYGVVTIDTLPEGAMVKITDAAGNMIKELGQSIGGEISWDITDFRHKRVPGGVYFVIASNGPDEDSFAKVAKILVVN